MVAQIGDALSYLDTNLTAATTYYYRVRAINIAQWSDYSNVAQAGTPGTGTDMPFDALTLWLRADAGLEQGSVNTPVNCWADQSGNGNNATQPVSGNQPLWVANVIDGRPTVHFDGTNSFFNFSQPAFLTGLTQAEAFVVLKTTVAYPDSRRSLWELGNDTNGVKSFPDTDGSINDDFGEQLGQGIGSPGAAAN